MLYSTHVIPDMRSMIRDPGITPPGENDHGDADVRVISAEPTAQFLRREHPRPRPPWGLGFPALSFKEQGQQGERMFTILRVRAQIWTPGVLAGIPVCQHVGVRGLNKAAGEDAGGPYFWLIQAAP
jgi:hypothetical protein